MGNLLTLWSAFAAALVSGGLCLFVVRRAPRNLLTVLVAALLGGIGLWNAAEWARLQFAAPWLLMVQGIGFGVLPALFLHFALLVSGRADRGTSWVVAAYAVTAALLIPAAGGLVFDALEEAYRAPAWNAAFVAFAIPVLGIAIGLLVRTWPGASKRERGMLAAPLLAALVCGPLGVMELIVPLGADSPSLANLGGAIASILFASTLLRHPEVFDAIATLQRSALRLFDSLDRGIVTFGPEGRVLFANERAAQLFGGVPERIDDVADALRAVFPSAGEVQLQQDGHVLQCVMVPVAAPYGGLAHVHLVVQDVTGIYLLMKDSARREGLAELGSAAASLAHEIRNALTSVRAASGRGPEPLESALDRLDRVVCRALDLTRPLDVDPVECDLGTLLQNIVRRLPSLPEVTLDAPDRAVSVSVDPELLAQVITNVVRNAADAGARCVGVVAEQQNGRAHIVVHNDGPPIPKNVLPVLFEPFTTTKSDGTGIGLALSRRIVTAHAGSIEMRNVKGGVECVLALPATS